MTDTPLLHQPTLGTHDNKPNQTASGRLVFYSLVQTPPGHSRGPWSGQIVQSWRSLRRYNRSIPVHLFHYGHLPVEVAQEADRHAVVVHGMGDDYAQSLAQYGNRGAALGTYRSLAKFRHLAMLPPATSVLYTDCDTFFFDDVEKLFETYCSGADIYYREEVMTRRSHYGYFPAWIDEDQLAAIAEQNHVRLMIPSNTGVVLMHNQVWLRMTTSGLSNSLGDYS